MVRSFPLEQSFLKDTSVFLTGGTGFVGKAILELLIREHFPHLKYIYCLVRGKPNMSVQERLIDSVMSNKIFNVVRDRLGPERWELEVEAKLVAIEGDISLEGLGVNANDLQLLQRDLGVVIHCAATVDFNERLDRSLTLNTLGTMQVLDLCDSCPNMRGFVHVSTAYVNSNRKELDIYERIYPVVFGEPKNLVKEIQSMDLPQIEKFTKEILKVYPNTYTFTKSLAENMAVERAEILRQRELKTGKPAWSMAIVRPTVVTSTAVDPVPGWVDGVSAANGIAMYIGMGVMDAIPGTNETALDLVPVDYLANIVIRACAEFKSPGTNFVTALADPSRTIRTLTSDLNIDKDVEVYPRIYHAASSAINPLPWKVFAQTLVSSWEKLPPLKKRVFPPAFHQHTSDKEYQENMELRQQYKFTTVAMLISLRDPQKGARLRSLQKKLDFLYHCFKHFMVNGWSFQSHNVFRVEKSQSERKDILSSSLDSQALQRMPWSTYLYFFIYGMYYFVLNESNSIRPHLITQGWECVLHKRPQLISSNMEVKSNQLNPYSSLNNQWKLQHMHDLRKKFIHHPNIQLCISNVANRLEKPEANIHQSLMKQVVQTEALLGMMTDDPEGTKTLYRWLAAGVESIHVNRSKALKLHDLISSRPKARVIYLPSHHSNLDFAILCHVLNKYDLPNPLIAAEGEGKLVGYLARDNILLAKTIFPSAKGDSKIRSTLSKTYLELILESQGSVALFVDEPPHNASYHCHSEQAPPPQLDIISSLNQGQPGLLNTEQSSSFLMEFIQNLKQSQIDGDDIILAPIAITYERRLDQSQILKRWAGEGEGEPLKVACIEPNEGKGRIHLGFGNCLTLNQLSNQLFQYQDLEVKDSALTHPVAMLRNNLFHCQLISPVALVALIISGYRQGITFVKARTLISKLQREVRVMGYNVDWQVEEDSTAVLSYGLEVIGPDHVTIELGLDDQHSAKSGPTPNQIQKICFQNNEISSLRLRGLISQIQHVFVFDGLFACAYYWCYQRAQKTEVGLPTLKMIQQCYSFLATLVQHHHPELHIQGTQNEFKVVLQRLESQDFIHLMVMDPDQPTDPVIVVSNDHLNQEYLHCSISIIYPTLDSLWATCCALSLLPSLGSLPVPQFVSLVQSNLREVHQNTTYPESCALPTLYHALAGFSSLGLVSIQNDTLRVPEQLNLAQELSQFLAPWCELPLSSTPNQVNDQLHRHYLNLIEQVSCAIEGFRHSPSNNNTKLPPFHPSHLPDFITSHTSPDSDSEPTQTKPPASVTKSVIQGWGQYLTKFIHQNNNQNTKPILNLPSPPPQHTRGNSV